MLEIGNIQLKGAGSADSTAERVQSAEKRKASANETLEDAWARIRQTKGYQNDKAKLDEVKLAMDEGKIGREPAEKGKKQKKFSTAEAKRMYNVLAKKKRKQRLKEMAETTPDNYWLITDEAKLAKFLRILDDADEIVFDVETTGTNVWTDYIVGHVITAIDANIHAYIPTKHKTNVEQLGHDYVTEKLRPYYEDEAIGKVAHNAK